MNILTINAGSSSIKYKAYEVDGQTLTPLVSGLIEGIGEPAGSWHHTKECKKSLPLVFKNHEEAFTALANKLKSELCDYPIQGVGHRVVHGGDRYFQPTRVDEKVLEAIRALSQLAPIHNPVNAIGIQFAIRHFPQATHVAIFDSGFHHTMPAFIRQYAINNQVAEQYQIKRYGFHGINHEYVALSAAAYLNKPLKECNLISLHLGNGASACLVKNGLSYDTSMGMTPLAGLVMGTRCGDIDPAIVWYLQQQGMTAQEVDELLNKQSGLKGIANDNDMRRVLERACANDGLAKLAIQMYVYAIQKAIGAYRAQAPHLDALIFTGGVGENAALIREQVITPLQHLGFTLDSAKNTERSEMQCRDIANGLLPILIIRGDEEALMARKVASFFS